MSTDICIVAEAGGFGGVEVHTMDLMEEFVERRCAVVLVESVSSSYPEHVAGAGLESTRYIHTRLSTGSTQVRDLLAWWRLLRSLDVSCLVVPKVSSTMGSVAFFAVCRLACRKVYMVEHTESEAPRISPSRRLWGVIPLGIGWWRKKLILGRYATSLLVNGIIAVSHSIQEGLSRNYRINPRRIHVIRSGVKVERLHRDPSAGLAFRAEHGITAQQFVFGFLGRLSHEKGADIAIEAAALLACEVGRSPFRLVITGSGREEAALRNRVEQLDVVDVVIFIPFQSEVASVLSAYDAIVQPSRSEGLGLAVLEGMAAGCVPVVTRVGGLPETVSSSDLGWTVEPESPMALRAAMSELLRLDRALLERRRLLLARHVQENFDHARSRAAIADLMTN